MERVINVFKATFKEPVPTSGKILNYDGRTQFVVSSIWSRGNIERKTNVPFERRDFLDWDKKNALCSVPIDTSSELLSKYSPNGKLRALFRDIPALGKSPKKQHLEIWDENNLLKVIDPTTFDLHGDVYTDGQFGCLSWSSCSRRILYVAEKKLPKSEPFLPQPKKKSEESTYGREYEVVEDWGETLEGKSSPVVVVCDLEKEDIVVVSSPPNISFGQALWAPDDSIISVGWESMPRRLGIVYCTNRPSWLYHQTLCGKFEKLTGDGVSVRSPVLSPDGTKIVWLEREVGGPHHACSRLMKYDFGTKKVSTVIDIVTDCITTTNGEQFYGLYGESLGRCWTDYQSIIISSPQRASVRLYEINIENGEVTDLTSCSSKTEELSETVLDVESNWILCTQSSFLKTPSLLVGRREKGQPIKWFPVVESRTAVEDFLVDILRLDADHDSMDVKNFSAIYIGPNANSQLRNVPVILFPHGGPHSSVPNKFSKLVSFFAHLGFAVCCPNYRGSTGHGQASVDFLPGRAGIADVHDVHQSILEVLEKHGKILDGSKCYLFGGSHGGFLVLHLAGQYPSFYRSVATRNPVTDISTVFDVSDIPDWAVVEGGYTYAPLANIDGSMYEEMKKKSPIHFVEHVQCPILLLVGKKDLRVPPNQGINYYYQLKARGVKTKMLIYSDNHGLTQNPHEVDWAINTALWFLEGHGIEH